MSFELAAEAGHAHELSNGETGNVDARLHVHEYLHLARAVVHEKFEAERRVGGRRLRDGPDYLDEQTFARLTDRAGTQKLRLDRRAVAGETDFIGICRRQDEQPEAVLERAGDLGTAPGRDAEVGRKPYVDTGGVILKGEAFVEEARFKSAGRRRHGTGDRNHGTQRQCARFGDRDLAGMIGGCCLERSAGERQNCEEGGDPREKTVAVLVYHEISLVVQAPDNKPEDGGCHNS